MLAGLLIVRSLAVVVVGGLALGLTGCVQGAPPSDPSPTPTAAAFFDSDEEALAAAEKAYRKYLEVSDLIGAEVGENSGRLKPYVTEDWLAKELEFFDGLPESGKHLEGELELVSVQLQQVDSELRAVTVYACLDLSNAHYVRGDGSRTTPDDRPDRVLMLLTFKEVRGELLLDGTEPWSSSC